MGSNSPVAILYSSDGYEVTVKNGIAIPASTSALILAGSDGANARYLSVDSSGRQVMVGAGTAGSPAGGVITIQGSASGTPIPISGSITANNASIGVNGSAIPGSSTQIGVSDGTNLQVLRGSTSNPAGTEFGLITRNIPSGTQTVSGTVASTQSGTWIVQPGNTANSTPWLFTINQGGNSATVSAGGALKVDGSAVTQPVSGTVTANAGTGNFNVIGTGSAGSAATGVVTVQGIASMTPIQVSQATAANLNATIVGTTAAGSGSSTGLVTVQGNASGTPIPVSGTVTSNQGGAPWTQNITQFGGNNVVTGTGASGVGIPRVTVANDSNILATQSGTWTVQPGNTANSTPWLTSINAGGNTAAVKPASTAATATDPALVVSISPNTSIATNIDGYVTTSAPTYTNNTFNYLSLTTGGALRVDGSAVTQPVSGTVTANQGGAPWSQNVTQFGGSNVVTGTGTSGAGIPRVTVSSDSNILATQSGTWTVTANAGTGNFTNASIGTTGSAAPASASLSGGSDGSNLKALLTDSSGRQIVIGAAANGSAVAGNPVLIAGSDGTNARSLKTDATGALATTATPVKSSIATVTSVAATGTNTTLLASNANRLGGTIYNDSNNGTVLVKCGATASSTSFTVKIFGQGSWDIPVNYTGQIDAIWTSVAGSAKITEFT
jgi:hypothetical protein